MTPARRLSIKENVLYTTVIVTFYSLGYYLQTRSNKGRSASWKTPNFTGNNGRSPIYPYKKNPYIFDHEELVEKLRMDATLKNELLTEYKVVNFAGFVHPQREDSDYALLSDAEYHQDI